jgi:hypothetical protein
MLSSIPANPGQAFRGDFNHRQIAIRQDQRPLGKA